MNKLQCTSISQCLKELARVMEQFGINDPVQAVKSEYVKNVTNFWISSALPSFIYPEQWSFALFELEGKPVFIGDELYCDDGSIFTIRAISKALKQSDIDKLSWTPPRKTATISINGGEAVEVELVSYLAINEHGALVIPEGEQLYKALQPLVKEN